MAKITYEDKSELEPEGTPKRTWRDIDANEAKNVVNTNDDLLGAQSSALSNHIANSANPHSVTASQVGLGSVDNTSDANKPVSTAQLSALNLKLDSYNKIVSITDNYTLNANGTDLTDIQTGKSLLFIFNHTTDKTFTIPNIVPAGAIIYIMRIGAGRVTIVQSSTTVNSSSGDLLDPGLNVIGSLTCTISNTFYYQNGTP